MGLFDWFLGKNKNINVNTKQKMDLFVPYFSGVYDPELNTTYVSICNAHARHLSKIKPAVYLKTELAKNKKYMSEILNLRMNPLMSASQGWEIVAKDYFMTNTAIIFIEWDYNNYKEPLKALWPLDPDKNSMRVVEGKKGGIYIKFYLDGKERVVDHDDIILLTRNAKPSTLFGQIDSSIDTVLKVMQTNYEGIEQAIKTSAFIRFLIQSTTPLKPEIKKEKAKAFADAYLGESGTSVAYVDQAEKVIPVNSKATYADEKQMNYFKEEIYRYLGANENILQAKHTEDQWQSYYEAVLEPFIIKLVDELTYKLLTKGERNVGNNIKIDANRLQTASIKSRILIANTLLKLPVVKPNMIVDLLYLPKLENGETEYAFLNYTQADKQNEYQGVKDDPKETENE